MNDLLTEDEWGEMIAEEVAEFAEACLANNPGKSIRVGQLILFHDADGTGFFSARIRL